jgi:hypothetical protein
MKDVLCIKGKENMGKVQGNKIKQKRKKKNR